MTIGLLKEPPYENRVSLIAEAVKVLTQKGITVLVENGAGEKAFCSNADYVDAGAKIVSSEEVITSADLILAINVPGEGLKISPSKILVGVYQPLYNQQLMQQWAQMLRERPGLFPHHRRKSTQ